MALLEGKYILHDNMTMTGSGEFQVLREKENGSYETVIPDAGRSRGFAVGLVDLLNAQGSEAGQTAE